MNGQDDKLGVHEESQDADPIPDAFPGQDPKVDRKWEKAKEGRWAVSLPPVRPKPDRQLSRSRSTPETIRMASATQTFGGHAARSLTIL
jgi:hypothetical protein